MAGICTNFRGFANEDVCEFVCDTLQELNNDAPTTKKMGTGAFKGFNHYATIGSTCIVGNEGNTSVYMLFSNGWQEV